MHLLMLTPALPYPPHQGGALRNFGIIHGLHQAGYKISLLSFDNSRADYAPLRELCISIDTIAPPARSALDRLRDLIVTHKPDLSRRLLSEAFGQRLRELLQAMRFDLIQFEGLEMAGYLPVVRQIQPEAKLCYDAHNAEYQLQKGIFEIDRDVPRRWPAATYSYIQYRRIAQFEREVCQQVDGVLAVSEEDAAALRPFRSDQCVAVIPNGIFTQEYTNQPEQLDLGRYVLTFTGKMDYRPNVDAMLWFASDILPLVQKAIPEAQLYIVGQKPHPRLEHLRDSENIHLTGWVPEVYPFLNATDVYIAPLRMGSGTRLKILEAMAAGRAVVATSLAAAGLPQQAKDTLRIADTAEEMAAAIIALLKDEEKHQHIGQAARKAVEQHYDWSVLIPRLLAAYKDMGLG